MVSLAKASPTLSTTLVPQVHARSLKLFKSLNTNYVLNFRKVRMNNVFVRCTKSTPWEPPPVTYAPTDDAGGNFMKKATNIFDTLNSEETAEALASSNEELVDTDLDTQPKVQFQLLKRPMWLLGPSLLLTTGMVPTLWLPLSSIFLGPTIASLLSLIGLDCIFNLGATLFLLMADSCSRPKSMSCNSKPPFSYKFWNLFASVSGFLIPLVMLFGPIKGFLQPELPPISFAVLLGPYLLLLSVQILTEMLTWHWQSPVWLVTPVVYEGYRILQLMRGLKLGAELSAPSWMLHLIRGLVSWWILILGIQLMSVAWFAGYAARAQQKQSAASVDSE